MESYTGRKIAIDASMAMYQFLVAVRSNGPGGQVSMLTNEAGDVTSHIQGMFNRTIKMMTSGIRPVYVFDGKPPQLKGGELAKRLARREKAEADLAQAKDAGEADDVDKFSRRLVKVTRQHNDECKELLTLMGVPYLNAPCEAEAQCAELARKNKVYATATEDMDALTFQTPKLVRKLTLSQSSKEKQPILEIDFNSVLRGLELTYEQFVDLCILCGCDYCSTIKGIGPKTALKLVKAHKNLENIIAFLQKDKKHEIPADWFEQRILKRELQEADKQVEEEETEEKQDEVTVKGEAFSNILDEEVIVNEAKEEDSKPKPSTESNEVTEDGDYEIIPPVYQQARLLFVQCEVTDATEIDLKWSEPNEQGLKDFLVDRMGFNVERVESGITRLKTAQQQKSQKRMDW